MQLNEAQINASKLADVFSGAFMEVTDLNGNSFEVKAERVPVKVTIDEDRKYINLEIIQRLKNITIEQAIMLANKINAEVIMARFYIVEVEGMLLLVADYLQNYERGLLAYHLVDNLKTFEKVVVSKFKENYWDYLP